MPKNLCIFLWEKSRNYCAQKLHIFARVHGRATNVLRPKNAGFLHLKNRCL
uniref:Uncharacterized protein n=1 Tax=Podoviridae sp. ct2iq11 TaxID=2827720 RepID=A0A8S5TPG4_9CAUD|nr:MAG TPA: hypothetical protein [Podoviridae sp. ct2iq11]